MTTENTSAANSIEQLEARLKVLEAKTITFSTNESTVDKVCKWTTLAAVLVATGCMAVNAIREVKSGS